MDLSAVLIPAAAIGGLGLLFGGGLGYAAIKFAVPVDEKTARILQLLPGANCGGCGEAGCEAMAKKMAKRLYGADGCPVCSLEKTAAIAELLGKNTDFLQKKTAHVRCRGDKKRAREKFLYEGIMSCQAAQVVSGGPKMCSWGCLGYGSCEKACPFKAITMVNGLPVINPEICTGCGICSRQCPRHVIELVPSGSLYHADCLSRDKGKIVKENCQSGCLACGLCIRQCSEEAIQIKEGHAVISYDRCLACGKCEEKCPTNVISHSDRV